MKLNEVCRRADRAVRLGAYPYASLLCEHILRSFPGDARARSLLGQASLGTGDHERARQQFDLALEFDPEDAAALAALGVVHSAEGRLGAAVKAFERAYDLNPGNDEVRDSLARLYAERDGGPADVPEAPPVAVARWRLRHEPLDTALDGVNTLLVGQPGNVAVALARAEALWRSGRLDDAERACRQILTRHPHYLKARLILGLILVADVRRQLEGVELLHLALADDPTGAVVGALHGSAITTNTHHINLINTTNTPTTSNNINNSSSIYTAIISPTTHPSFNNINTTLNLITNVLITLLATNC